MRNLAEELRIEILEDEHFAGLFSKAEKICANKIFQLTEKLTISKQDYLQLMRYADILSHSEDADARNRAYKIVSLLVEDFGRQEDFKLLSGAVLAKLGNFPALEFLKNNYAYIATLPIERQVEKDIKVDLQKTSNEKGIFTDAQFKIRKELESHDYFSFSGPTSIGKSFIMKDYIRHLLQTHKPLGGSIVIVVPTRALITQVVSELRKEIDDKEVNIASHPVVSKYSMQRYKEHVFVFTPERLLGYVNGQTPPIKYLFVDEAQKVIAPNDSRSSLYYHAIYETIRKFAAKLIFASPNIPNPDIFLQLFEKDTTGTIAVTEQTVSQNRYFIDLKENQIFLFSELGHKEALSGFNFNTDPNKIIKSIGNGVNNIVYCNAIAETVTRAKDFASSLEEIQMSKELEELISFVSEYVHKDYFLIECLKKGVAFHHGRMPQKIRRKIEDFFADKKSPLRYIFCTSTLLEGVNLPAKNIFVLNDSHGLQNFEKIDFENLIGRAGRLTKEFSGNVICIRDQARRWQEGGELLKKVKLEAVDSFLTTKSKTRKEFLNIGKALSNEKISSSLRVGERENITHYASLILLHQINDENSLLKQGFLQKYKDAPELLQSMQSSNKVPAEIIRACSTIKPIYQNRVLAYIEREQEKAILNINSSDNALIADTLGVLYDLYNWAEEESRGKDPLIPSGLVKKGYGKTRLKYWAMLLRNWTRLEPLNRLIAFSINYYQDRGEIWFSEDGVPKNESFTGSPKQINIIIEEIMNDIETGLRFKIEKYFLNYYLLLKHVLGEERAGKNWSEFIEYGTTDKRVIELQNIGFSRGASKHILNEHYDMLSFNQDDELLDIQEDGLIKAFDKESEYYEEVEEFFR